MAVGLLSVGSIYSIWYSNWKTNTRNYVFILYGGGPKVHSINIGAKQLNIIDRAKIVRVIVKLAKIKSSTKYTGVLLYKIFKQYLPKEIKKCYRTYHKVFITQASLINYGLNSPEDFTQLELSMQDKQLYEKARRDFLIKMLNLYSGRGVKKAAIENTFATPIETTTKTTENPEGSEGGENEPDGYY